LTLLAGEALVPMFFTVALSVIGSVSTGAAGEAVSPVTVRSGFGPGTPMTWSSATWPPPAPELLLKISRTSATRAVTGMVTVLPEAGSKE
jgi:hypothetical protein